LSLDNGSASNLQNLAESSPHNLLKKYGALGTVAQNEVLKFEISNRSAERLIDDFGRVVAIKNPGQEWQYAEYDEANRIVHVTDPRGAEQLAHYNLQGHLIELKRLKEKN